MQFSKTLLYISATAALTAIATVSGHAGHGEVDVSGGTPSDVQPIGNMMGGNGEQGHRGRRHKRRRGRKNKRNCGSNKPKGGNNTPTPAGSDASTAGSPQQPASNGSPTTPKPAGASPSNESAPATSGSMSTDEQQTLKKHNDARAQVGVSPLQWDTSLVQEAKQWAETLRSQNCGFEHSGGKTGENLAMGTSMPGAVDLWMTEKKDYNGQAVGNSNAVVGHYTQIVWSTTTKVGCYWDSKCRTTVCNYSPAGNYVGRKPY